MLWITIQSAALGRAGTNVCTFFKKNIRPPLGKMQWSSDIELARYLRTSVPSFGQRNLIRT